MSPPVGVKIPSKLYYRIGEVSELVGVGAHVLRYWESEFRSVRPQKSQKGQRIYSRRDVGRLLKIKELLYGQGFTIAGARKKLREADPGLEPTPNTNQLSQLRAILTELRRGLVEMLVEVECSGTPHSLPPSASGHPPVTLVK